jgi:hypothetical protein
MDIIAFTAAAAQIMQDAANVASPTRPAMPAYMTADKHGIMFQVTNFDDVRGWADYASSTYHYHEAPVSTANGTYMTGFASTDFTIAERWNEPVKVTVYHNARL